MPLRLELTNKLRVRASTNIHFDTLAILHRPLPLLLSCPAHIRILLRRLVRLFRPYLPH